MNTRDLARLVVPFPVRLELLRLKRLPGWILETPTIARRKTTPDEAAAFGHLLSCHESPLERTPGAVPERLQRGKERNVEIAAARIDGVLIPPNRIFSYHRLVGRPSRLRGFRTGLELHGGAPSQGVGGGCCQVSNALYLLAVRGGMKITERHRHGLDLFPDHDRQVPFGCGATVFYNYADFRFENPLPQPVLIRLRIEDRCLVGELWAAEHPGWVAEIYETSHRFFRQDGAWWRENRVWRIFRRTDGSVLLDQELAHNIGRVLYDPEEANPCGEPA